MKKASKIFALIVVSVMILTSVLALAACTKNVEELQENAIKELTSYAETQLSVNYYTATAKAQVQAALESGIEAIKAADSKKAIDKALADAKAAIDSVAHSDGYTYNAAFSLSPSTWNPHQYKSTTDAVVHDYTTVGWWDWDFNDDFSGFEWVDVMAIGEPTDVTSTYAGEAKGWGIKEGETNRAFRIKLNPDAKWDNGDSITADDYIYSLQKLLDPNLLNYRASNMYGSAGGIIGAKSYFYSGRSGWDAASVTYEEGEYTDEELATFVWTWGNGTVNGATNDLRAYYQGVYGSSYPNMMGSSLSASAWLLGANAGFSLGITLTAAQIESLEGKTMAEINADPTLKAYADEIIEAWGEDVVYMTIAKYSFPEVSWDKVGLIKVDDYTLDWLCEGQLFDFYIRYNLGLTLVYKPLYEACLKQDPVTKVWSSTYGSSVDTWMGYGPYILTQYITDQLMVFEKNPDFFLFQDKYAEDWGTFVREIDGETVEQYQATKVVLRYAPDLSTREQMFLRGELVGLGLDADLLAKYSTSRSLYYTKGASTFYGIIASDYDNLVEREAILNNVKYDAATYDGSKQAKNKTILAIKEFRQALCLGLDRFALCQALSPAATPAKSLFSDLIVADPNNGINLNNIEAVRAAICEYWGFTKQANGKWLDPDGETVWDTTDKAYNSITGYDPDYARELIDIAVDKAIELGWMSANSIVSIEYCAADDSDIEKKYYEAFRDAYTNLMKGTKLENKFEYTANYTLGSDFGDIIRTGSCDTAWGFGWSGGEFDPYDLFQVYVDAAFDDDGYQYDCWIDWSDTDVKITLPVNAETGEYDASAKTEMTYNVAEWFFIINGGEEIFGENYPEAAGLPNWSFGNMSDTVRATVLAEIQKTVLLNYTTIPMYCQGGAQLKSYQINYGREGYTFPMGFGGLRYVTFNYNDAEWAAFLASQGGILTY